VFDMALGWDDVLHRVRPTDRFKANLSITAVTIPENWPGSVRLGYFLYIP
jgi:hypothetical protein